MNPDMYRARIFGFSCIGGLDPRECMEAVESKCIMNLSLS